MRRVGALIVTVLVATALAHVFLQATNGETLASAIGDTPRHLVDGFVHRDFGETSGRRCNQFDQYQALCASYTASTVAAMLRERVPVDVALLLGGAILGTLAGVAAGRWCAVHPESRRTRVLHVLTALQLATPVFFQACSSCSTSPRTPATSSACRSSPARATSRRWARTRSSG